MKQTKESFLKFYSERRPLHQNILPMRHVAASRESLNGAPWENGVLGQILAYLRIPWRRLYFINPEHSYRESLIGL